MKKVLIPILFFYAASWVIAGGAGQEKGARREKAEQKTIQTPTQETAQTEKAAAKPEEKAEDKGAKAKKSAEEAKKTEETKKADEAKKAEDAKKTEEAKKTEKAKKAEDQDDEAKDEAKGKGKDKAQQGAAREKQLVHEEEKHLARQARLEKMLEVAKDKGDDKAVARIQSLMDKEKARFDKKQAKMTGRAAGIPQEAAETGKKPEPKKEKNKD